MFAVMEAGWSRNLRPGVRVHAEAGLAFLAENDAGTDGARRVDLAVGGRVRLSPDTAVLGRLGLGRATVLEASPGLGIEDEQGITGLGLTLRIERRL